MIAVLNAAPLDLSEEVLSTDTDTALAAPLFYYNDIQCSVCLTTHTVIVHTDQFKSTVL